MNLGKRRQLAAVDPAFFVTSLQFQVVDVIKAQGNDFFISIMSISLEIINQKDGWKDKNH